MPQLKVDMNMMSLAKSFRPLQNGNLKFDPTEWDSLLRRATKRARPTVIRDSVRHHVCFFFCDVQQNLRALL